MACPYCWGVMKEEDNTVAEGEKRVLRRSRRDRWIAGVCGGLGQFFGLSPAWFRIGFLIALIPGGVPGILLYLLFWLIIPAE